MNKEIITWFRRKPFQSPFSDVRCCICTYTTISFDIAMHSRTTDRGDRSHPPLVPKIPIQAVHSLIPRLTTTINDIDAFKALLASGNQDGSLPNW